MADLSFIYNQDLGFSDIQISGGDFVLDDTLQTAVELSIFTDRRATLDEVRMIQTGIQERQSRRGYWANSFKEDPQGSGLWLLQREKRTQSNLARAQTFCNDALAWMVKDGIVASVSAVASYVGESLVLVVSIKKPDGQDGTFKYQYAWDDLETIHT